MNRVVILVISLLFPFLLSAQKRVKVACVGNSITYGHGLSDREKESYPVQLQQLLGNGYEVTNFGKPGATLLSKGHCPYMQQMEFDKALQFAGDIVVIHLGINDTDPRNWPNYRDLFVKDYIALIDTFRRANPVCRILIARLTPITFKHPRFESGTRDWHGEIQRTIEIVAEYTNAELIDFHKPLYSYPHLLPDAVHPTKEGLAILAENVYSVITGDFGGLQMPLPYSDNMILQHNSPLKIRGKGNAGDKVTVAIAQQKHTTAVSKNGQWEIILSPIKAGGPYTLIVSSGRKTLKYENVLAGEVWLCSGQSNMGFTLKGTLTGKVDIPNSANPNIRFFNMKPRWTTNTVEWDAQSMDSLNHLQYYKNTKWVECSSATASSFSGVAYYFGKMLQDSLKIPVGLICNAVGGSPAESWIDRSTLEHQFPAILRDWLQNDYIQEWARERAALNIKKAEGKLQRHPFEPCYLYESGILPLESFPVKGVIWYQGESNAHNWEVHEKLFELLVNSWRMNWKNENMPFYYVQLSSLERPSWTWFRDSQRRIMNKIPFTGMAVSSDQGDSLDVHPTNKKPVGERLARWALHHTYDKSHITPSGPLFKNMENKNGVIWVNFEYGTGLKTSDNQSLRSFEIAEVEGLYYPATAEIVGNQVRLSNENIRIPRFVRYGWQPFTRANLVNMDELPASTFQARVSEK